MTKVYIDGSEGTTGLRINERFKGRDDIEILTIPSELRKDVNERRKYINESDITFLCLPDAAAIEAVSLVENENVTIIDASTAHRTSPGWVYGFPELSEEFRENIRNSKRIANPGCYASGFISLAYPLVKMGIIGPDFPISAFALSGYSGAGKKTIAIYESDEKTVEMNAPREYALTQKHKHLKEMKAITRLSREPLFTPIVDDYYSGMIVNIPLYVDMIGMKPEELQKVFADFYKGEKFINVKPFDAQTEELNGFMAANSCSGWDGMEIYICGNDDRILLSSRFDNLGKGASGAAIQCMNIVLGCDEAKGLNL